MFIHVFFVFPETAGKTLEEIEHIFDDSTPGSIRFLGTPAWKTRVNRHVGRMERGEMDAEEKSGLEANGGMGRGARHVEEERVEGGYMPEGERTA